VNPIRARRERRALEGWDRRSSLVFDERSSTTHRITCLTHDLTDAARLREFGDIATAALSSGIAVLVLDLRRVSDADSKLVGLLLQLIRIARARRVRLRLSISSSVDAWITVCRVERFFKRTTDPAGHSDSPDHALAPVFPRLAS
jgi:anti-anti-sigma regulatory factor